MKLSEFLFGFSLFAAVSHGSNITQKVVATVEDILSCHSDPDICRNASEIITSKGYPCEEHTVQTQDGFLLTMQRIPHGRNKHGGAAPRGVAFLQHGLLGAATNWIANSANQSLGFLLADAGYDVWLGNLRGNTYGRKHVTYSPDQAQFWKWSFDEMAKYDLPAMISYTLKKTGGKQLHYVGHSQGTMIAFAHLSRNPDLNKQIKSIFALAPVASVGHIEGALRPLSFFTEDFVDVLDMLGVHDFLPSTLLLKLLAATLCDSPTKVVCSNIMFLIAGYDTHNLNMTRLPVYIAHTPAGTSVQNIVHFSQLVRSSKFQMFNYGSDKANLAHYGQKVPPMYNPAQVKVPIASFSGGKDWLADPTDVKWVESLLPNIFYKEQIEDFNHLDFIWGVNTGNKVYEKVIQLMQKHDS